MVFFTTFKQGPGGFLSLLVVGGCRQCWGVAFWPDLLGLLALPVLPGLKILKTKITKGLKLEGLRAFFLLFSSSEVWDDWEIKWVLRTMVPSAEVRS